jgi:hypothetical protein
MGVSSLEGPERTTTLSAGVQMGLGGLGGQERAGALENILRAQLAPGQNCDGSRELRTGDALAVYSY